MVNLLVLDASLPPDGARAVLERMEADPPPTVVVTAAVPGDGLWAYALNVADCIPDPLTLGRLQGGVDARARSGARR